MCRLYMYVSMYILYISTCIGCAVVVSSFFDCYVLFSFLKVSSHSVIITNCLKIILDDQNKQADSCCMLLCNLSRTSLLANHVVDCITDFDNTLDKLIDAFCDLNYNKKHCKLHYLAPFFSNISQSPSAVEWVESWCTYTV